MGVLRSVQILDMIVQNKVFMWEIKAKLLEGIYEVITHNTIYNYKSLFKMMYAKLRKL